MTDTSKARPKLPMGNMKVSKAKQRWEDVRKAAQSGDPAAMMDAVSRFQGIADTMLAYFENRDRLRTELDEAKAEIKRLNDLLEAAEQACEDRADRLDDFGLESECCAATARNCASDIDALKGSSQ